MSRTTLAALLVVVTLAVAASARAEGDSDATLFASGVAALDSEAWDLAVDRFELLADRGFSHPDASYDRGLAYVRRAQSHSARPGDLGRAAAALSESLLLRPGDAGARQALERVRQEIVRRRARVGAKDVDLRPSLGWAVVGLLAEDTWALVAALGSLVAVLGLILRFAVSGHRLRLTGVVAASLGAVVIVVPGCLAALARYERVTRRPAIVVVEEARLADESGVTISGPGAIVPEGASVRVGEVRGTLAHVEWGTIDGWLSLGQLRLLARP